MSQRLTALDQRLDFGRVSLGNVILSGHRANPRQVARQVKPNAYIQPSSRYFAASSQIRIAFTV